MTTLITGSALAVLLAAFGGVTWLLTEPDEHRKTRLAARTLRRTARKARR